MGRPSGSPPIRCRVPISGDAHLKPAIASASGVIGCATSRKGGMRLAMRHTLVAALLAEAFAHEIVFERPPHAVQRALAVTVAPLARRRGRSVTGDIMRTAIVPAERWPGPSDPGPVISPH